MDRALTPDEFNEHANKIIRAASGDGVIPNDVICATAKALGTLVAFTARREQTDLKKLIKFCQGAMSDFAYEAEKYMRQNPQNAPPQQPSKKWSLAHVFVVTLLLMMLVFVTSNLSDGGAELGHWMRNGRPFEVIGYLFGQLFGIPILAVIGFWIRNRFVN